MHGIRKVRRYQSHNQKPYIYRRGHAMTKRKGTKRKQNEDTNGVSRSRTSKGDRQCNNQNKKDNKEKKLFRYQMRIKNP